MGFSKTKKALLLRVMQSLGLEPSQAWNAHMRLSGVLLTGASDCYPRQQFGLTLMSRKTGVALELARLCIRGQRMQHIH
jgi:hypothetical protein